MSGLSMADMRRIGERRNQSNVKAEPQRSSLLKKLPFLSGSQADANPKPSDRLTAQPAALPPASSYQTDPLPGSLPEPAPTASPAIFDGTFGDKQASKPLRAHDLRHTALGATLGAVAGAGATGALLALPTGAVLGGVAGSVLAKRSYAEPNNKAKTLALTAKMAPQLIQSLQRAAAAQGVDKARISVTLARSCALDIVSFNAKSQKVSLTLGLALLHGLSSYQLGLLFAQKLAVLQLTEGEGAVEVDTVLELGRLKDSLTKRSHLMRLQNLDTVRSVHQHASQTWMENERTLEMEADRRAAMLGGAAPLVDALLAQALIAAHFGPLLRDQDDAYHTALRGLKDGWTQPTLNQALTKIGTHPTPEAYLVKDGLPYAILDRIGALDTTCPVPTLPSLTPAFAGLSEKAQQSVAKTFESNTPKRKKRRKTKPDLITASEQPSSATMTALTKAGEPSAAPPKTKEKKSLFSGLFSSKKGKQSGQLQSTHLAHEPLYEADDLYQSDPSMGIEAYQALVDAHPRWALARLRLGEALINGGYAEGVGHLAASVATLPSALPSILDTLQGALAMVSPLEAETLRQSIHQMAPSAPAIAAERSEIDLMRLDAPTFDAEDQKTLIGLFESMGGLREVWAFGAACVGMPEVPHHALIGLAPRVKPEDAAQMAVTLAEHAAITGTVAVHVETGTPSGPLGDALASQTSLWRAGFRS